MINKWEEKNQEPEKINMFQQLWTDVRYFFDNLEIGETALLKERLDAIKKDIKTITKIALIRNLERTDDPKITLSRDKNVRVETKNFYPNILDINNLEHMERNLISYATEWSIQKTTKELGMILEKKITEESYRNEILNTRTYAEVLDLLKIRFIKIEDKILAFEDISTTVEVNRIGLLLYILGTLWHKLRVYGNDREAYIYDMTIDKTFICGNITGYKTYIAQGKKDLYDLWELTKEEVEKEFTIINYEWANQREAKIKNSIENKLESESVSEKNIPEVHQEIDDTIFSQDLAEGEKEDGKENENTGQIEKIRSEFIKFYTDEKFNYEAFKKHMLDNCHIDLPKKLSSLNAIFGRNPYIFMPKYTIAILKWDKSEIIEIEKEMRDKRYQESNSVENNQMRTQFTQYFWLKTDGEKKEFRKQNPDLFRNLRHKAQKLWGLTIGSEEYIHSLLENNPAKAFIVAEREYSAAVCKCFPYSKKVSDLIKDFKNKRGDLKNLSKYMEYVSQWQNPKIVMGDVLVNANPDEKKLRGTSYTRMLSNKLSKKDIIEIFKDPQTGKIEVTQGKYESYLHENAEEQSSLPKTIYDFITYFKEEDVYASNMIHSIKYLQALLTGNIKKAKEERQIYCQKKIEESKNPEIQNMLMFVWRYLEKNGDKSCSDWTIFAKPEVIDKMMNDNPNLKKRILNNANSIASYSITNFNTNFNNLDYSSLKTILAPKIKEISQIAPDIYIQSFVM